MNREDIDNRLDDDYELTFNKLKLFKENGVS